MFLGLGTPLILTIACSITEMLYSCYACCSQSIVVVFEPIWFLYLTTLFCITGVNLCCNHVALFQNNAIISLYFLEPYWEVFRRWVPFILLGQWTMVLHVRFMFLSLLNSFWTKTDRELTSLCNNHVAVLVMNWHEPMLFDEWISILTQIWLYNGGMI